MPLSRVYSLILRNIVLERSKPARSPTGNRGRAICSSTVTIFSHSALLSKTLPGKSNVFTLIHHTILVVLLNTMMTIGNIQFGYR